MHWIPSSEKAYVVLSKKGNLYYGEVDIPLKNVMSGVDAGMLIFALELST